MDIGAEIGFDAVQIPTERTGTYENGHWERKGLRWGHMRMDIVRERPLDRNI